MTNEELDIAFESYFAKGLQCYALVHPKPRSGRRKYELPDWLSITKQILPIVRTWPEDRDGRIALHLHFESSTTLLYIPLASEIKAIYPYDYVIKHHPEAIL